MTRKKMQKICKNYERLTRNRETWTINELKGSNLTRYNKMQDWPSIRIETWGEILEYLLDTDAKINAMNDGIFCLLNNAELWDNKEKLKCANINYLQISGKTRLEVEIRYMKQLVDFTVVNEMILSVIRSIEVQSNSDSDYLE